MPETFDHHTPDFADNWRTIYAKMRGECPVAHSEAHGGFTTVTTYQEVRAALVDHDSFVCDRNPVLSDGRQTLGGVTLPINPFRMGMMEMDPPESTRYRKVLTPWFSRKAVDNVAPHIRDLVGWCLDRVIEQGRMDVVDDLANPLPALVTLDILGLPLENWDLYASILHEAGFRAKGSAKRIAWLLDDIRATVEDRRANPLAILTPLDSLLAEKDGEPLFDDDIVVEQVFMLLNGGVDTTTSMIAHCMRHLSTHPETRQQLVEDPSLIPDAVSELLRHHTPGTGVARTVSKPVEIGGTTLAPGERVYLALGSANNDPERFDDPDRVDIARDARNHLAFGAGMHRCLGQFLAIRELTILIEEVLRRIPDFEVEEDGCVPYPTIPLVSGYQAMPATFTPGTRIGTGPAMTVPPTRSDRVSNGFRAARVARAASGEDASSIG